MHAVLSESSFLLVQRLIIFGIGLTVCTEKTLPVVGEGVLFFGYDCAGSLLWHVGSIVVVCGI